MGSLRHFFFPLLSYLADLPRPLRCSSTNNRSLAACEQLSRAGYTELAWVSGGLDTVRPGQVETVPADKDLRYSAIGGLSAVVGWTEVQQEENKDKDGSFGLVLKVVSNV